MEATSEDQQNLTPSRFVDRFAVHRLTVFGRAVLLIVLEVLANAICWAVASRFHSILGLAILAWTIGLRHALDADHISAIDNATRTLINHGQLPVTCGLIFSLGHSTIVIVVNVAIVISTKIYNKLHGIGSVGSIVGTAVSAGFLFIVGLSNSIILWRILRQRRQVTRNGDAESGIARTEQTPDQSMLMMRLLGPLVNFVDRPWKMYPVGVLFGFGFDTASSIALLAISALARENEDGSRISAAEVVLLPVLFTTAMTLVDSLDSILMIYSYSGFAECSWRIFDDKTGVNASDDRKDTLANDTVIATLIPVKVRANDSGPTECGETDIQIPTHLEGSRKEASGGVVVRTDERNGSENGNDRIIRLKQSTMSKLSIILTAMSISLAFSISLIEIMGLIGENCKKCQDAASAPDGGGIAGEWWRGWAQANDDTGYIGIGVVGAFVIIVSSWYLVRWGTGRIRGPRMETK
ncbi:NicO-domain-containing protein [Phlebopus sp. FC_14]|nr:NicO-domain-containing protein [Phlebopus sp. FC_14]